MAHDFEICHFSPQFYLFVSLAFLLQGVYSYTIGRDTLKTIAADESYEMGYHRTTVRSRKTYLYSASSSNGLLRLARRELQIYKAAVVASGDLHASGESRLENLIHEYLQDYNETSGFLMNETVLNGDELEASEVAGDLLGAYRMVRRFRNYIQRGLCEALASLASRQSNCSEGVNTLKPRSAEGPFKRDMHLSMFAIIFTQLQYGWSPHTISTGTIEGMELGTTLKAVHCIELGVHAVASRFFSVGIDWLELALVKIQNGDSSVDLNFARDLLEQAKAEHDELWHPLTFWPLNATFFTKRLNDTSVNESREWERSIAIDSSDKARVELVEDRSWDICTGLVKQTEKVKSELFCWHETTVHPTWKLGPLKAELLAKFAYQVIQFHNLFGSGIIQQIQTRSDAVLQAGTYMYGASREFYDPKLRLCEVCHVSCQELDSLTQRVTGLVRPGEKETPAPIFPPGGHTRLHLDKTGKDYSERRIATLIYFLEDSKIGGELVFPNARVAAKPIKGSAVLWYNLFKSSELDYSTTHASCSLVKGQKKLTIHWIPYILQAHLTCDTDSNAKLSYLFNGKSNL